MRRMTSAGRTATAAAAVALVAALAAAAAGSPATGAQADPARTGGTLTLLTTATAVELDPQAITSTEDRAFVASFLHRTLTAYPLVAGKPGTVIAGDLATDTGRPSSAATVWAFTLRKGVTFQDGTAITCADVKYDVARSFATGVIGEGLGYARYLLDIPEDSFGRPTYRGPYVKKGNDVAAFDRAVTCSPDNRTITFRLAQSASDFNRIVSLPEFAPVPKAADTKGSYGGGIQASGPYLVDSIAADRLVLRRNEEWKSSSDPIRAAYPNRVIVRLGMTSSDIDAALKADAAADQASAPMVPMLRVNASRALLDPVLAARRVNDTTSTVTYLGIDLKKVPNRLHRRAIAAGIDRAGLVAAAGGAATGQVADGLVSRALGADYAATGMWTGALGKAIAEGGDPAYARKLVTQSGKPMPALTLDCDTADIVTAGIIVETLDRAGIAVTLRSHADSAAFFDRVFDAKKRGALVLLSWTPDVASGARVIEPILTPDGGFDLTSVDDSAYTSKVLAALALTDPSKASKQWASLNTQASTEAWMVPLSWARRTYLVGSRVRGQGMWWPYGTLAFGALSAVG